MARSTWIGGGVTRNSVRVAEALRRAREEQRARDVDEFGHERWLDDRTADVYAALDARAAGDVASDEADAAVAAAVWALAADPDGARRAEAMLDLQPQELAAVRDAGRGWRRRV